MSISNLAQTSQKFNLPYEDLVLFYLCISGMIVVVLLLLQLLLSSSVAAAVAAMGCTGYGFNDMPP